MRWFMRRLGRWRGGRRRAGCDDCRGEVGNVESKSRDLGSDRVQGGEDAIEIVVGI
jgi:hypothetical protein